MTKQQPMPLRLMHWLMLRIAIVVTVIQLLRPHHPPR
jgi:hypothetical protein